ncbi:MAG: tetratricopeptide repeat protein [Limisphaerales bacterium]
MLVLAVLPLLARAQADAEFIGIYNLIQEGETLERGGDTAGAYQRYLTARRDLDAFTRAHPAWNPTIVKFRRGFLDGRLGDLKARVPVADRTAPLAPQPTADDRAADLALRAAQLADQLAESQRQAQQVERARAGLEAERETLKAKLREALAARPADVDPAAFQRAEERVTALLKENEVLKASLERQAADQAKAAEALGQAAALEKELADARAKLKAQRAAADGLVLENDRLTARLRAGSQTNEVLLLQTEVGRLHRELETARAEAATAAGRSRELGEAIASGRTDLERAASASAALNRELNELRGQFAEQADIAQRLRTDNENLARQLAAFTAREAQAAAVATDADRERIQALERERDQLRRELVLAREELHAREADRAGERATETARWQGRVETLEARVQALEAKPDPYTPEELALFQEPARREVLPMAAAAVAPAAGAPAPKASEVIAASVAESLAGALPAEPEARTGGTFAVKPRPATGPAMASNTAVPVRREEAPVAAPTSSRPIQLAQATPPTEPPATTQPVPPPAPATNAQPAVASDPPTNAVAEPPRPSVESGTATNAPPRRRTLRDLPPGAGVLAAEAQRHFARRQLPEAEAKYQEILRLDERNVFTLANLAAIQIELGKLPDAEANLRRGLDVDPNDAFSLSLLGIVRFRQERYDDAFDLLSRAAAIDPENAETQNYLGITLSQKGQRAPAEAALRKAVRLSPTLPSAHYNLAVVYATQKPAFVELARFHYGRARRGGHPANPALEKILSGEAPATN